MAIRAKKAEIIPIVILRVTIDMIKLDRDR